MFKTYSNQQILPLPPSLDELIEQNHPVRVVDHIIDKIDITPLIKTYKGGSTTSYHPRMLLKVITYAYFRNTYSSMAIEAQLKENIHFMWLSWMSRPDHNTIFRFRSKCLKKEIKNIFALVVGLLVRILPSSYDKLSIKITKILRFSIVIVLFFFVSSYKNERTDPIKKELPEPFNLISEVGSYPFGNETYFEGHISNYQLMMKLNYDEHSHKIEGLYYYNSVKTEIQLKGYAKEDSLFLYELTNENDTLATFYGQIKSNKKITGRWKSPDKEFPFSLILSSKIDYEERLKPELTKKQQLSILYTHFEKCKRQFIKDGETYTNVILDDNYSPGEAIIQFENIELTQIGKTDFYFMTINFNVSPYSYAEFAYSYGLIHLKNNKPKVIYINQEIEFLGGGTQRFSPPFIINSCQVQAEKFLIIFSSDSHHFASNSYYNEINSYLLDKNGLKLVDALKSEGAECLDLRRNYVENIVLDSVSFIESCEFAGNVQYREKWFDHYYQTFMGYKIEKSESSISYKSYQEQYSMKNGVSKLDSGWIDNYVIFPDSISHTMNTYYDSIPEKDLPKGFYSGF